MKVDDVSTKSAAAEVLPAKPQPALRLLDALLSLINEIPESKEPQAVDPLSVARQLVAKASLKAAAISGTLALPPGPAGWLTILPDLMAVWHVQRQMVSDIASVFGKRPQLTSETMVYCLFRHAAAQALRDLVTRVGIGVRPDY